MAFKKRTIEDLDDGIIDMNDHRVKKLKDDYKGRTFEPSLKAAKKIAKSSVKKVESLDLDSLETKLNRIAAEKQKAEKIVKKAEESEKQGLFKKAKKKKKKEREKQIRLMFSATESEDESSEDDDVKGSNKPKIKNDLVKDTEGTLLDQNIGRRFGHLYAMQIDDYNYLDKIVKEIKDDLETSPSKNMYRTSQVSNLLSALGQKRTLLNDMTSMAKTVSDLELKYAKEERANKEEKGDNNALASSIGVSIIRGLYDDVFEENIKKKKKESKKRKDDEDDDDEDDISSKKDANKRLAERVAKSVLFTDYEKNIDIEGKFKICVLADKENPEDDWKFIIVDEDGERRKDWERERPEILPNKKEIKKMKFMLDKLKATDRTRKWDLILK